MNKLNTKNFNWYIPILFFLTAFSLVWQTKLVIYSAQLNYWEISLFLSIIFLFIFIIFNLKYLLLNFKNLKSLNYFLIFLVLWEVFIIISIFFSSNYLLSLYRYFIFLLAALFFLIVRKLSLAKKDWLILGFLSAMFFQAIIAIWQFINQKSIACKYLGMAFHDASVLGTAVIETSSARWLRAYGALDHPNILGGLVAMAVLVSAWYLIKKSYKKIEFISFFWLIYLTCLTALFFSFSRSAWLAFFIAMLSLLLYLIRQKIYTSRVILVCLASILLLTPLIIVNQDLVKTRLLSQGRLELISKTERQESLKDFRFNSKKEFLFGRGFGNFSFWQFKKDQDNQQALAIWQYQPIHNSWLLLLAEIGIFGFLSALIFFYFVIKRGLIKRKNFFWPSFLVLLIFFIIFFFDHWPLSLVSTWWIIFLFLGLIE
jgi:O-antigen ligase